MTTVGTYQVRRIRTRLVTTRMTQALIKRSRHGAVSIASASESPGQPEGDNEAQNPSKPPNDPTNFIPKTRQRHSTSPVCSLHLCRTLDRS